MATRKRAPAKPAVLPDRIMLDSGVIIRALEHANSARKGDPRVVDCRRLWERALRECRVLPPPRDRLSACGDGAAHAALTPDPWRRPIEHPVKDAVRLPTSQAAGRVYCPP